VLLPASPRDDLSNYSEDAGALVSIKSVARNDFLPWRDRPCSELKAYICEQTL
jgi:hypothetical protein